MCEMELRGRAMGWKWCGVVTFDTSCASGPLCFAFIMGGVWLKPRAPFQRSKYRVCSLGLSGQRSDTLGAWTTWLRLFPATERSTAALSAHAGGTFGFRARCVRGKLA